MWGQETRDEERLSLHYASSQGFPKRCRRASVISFHREEPWRGAKARTHTHRVTHGGREGVMGETLLTFAGWKFFNGSGRWVTTISGPQMRCWTAGGTIRL